MFACVKKKGGKSISRSELCLLCFWKWICASPFFFLDSAWLDFSRGQTTRAQCLLSLKRGREVRAIVMKQGQWELVRIEEQVLIVGWCGSFTFLMFHVEMTGSGRMGQLQNASYPQSSHFSGFYKSQSKKWASVSEASDSVAATQSQKRGVGTVALWSQARVC